MSRNPGAFLLAIGIAASITALGACKGRASAAGDSSTAAAVADGSGGDAPADTAPSPCATRPLTAGDVAQYASVMHTAADRWANLPAADRDALATARALGSTPSESEYAANSAKLQRAAAIRRGMDRVVAAEQHIPLDCYDAITNRIEAVVPSSEGGASGGDPEDHDLADTAQMTPAELAHWKAVTSRWAADNALVTPHRAELQPLIHEVRMDHAGY